MLRHRATETRREHPACHIAGRASFGFSVRPQAARLLGDGPKNRKMAQPASPYGRQPHMPRVARKHAPGVVTHVITRFVDGRFVMDDVPGARAQYISRLDRALVGSDWRLLWYCLMGSHVHLGMLSGEQDLQHWIRGLNSGFASWANAQRRKLGIPARGPVIAERPTSVMVPTERAGYLAAYIHNNPRRARVVSRAVDCTWSSHRVYALGEPGSPSLDFEAGLALCGFGTSAFDRSLFDQWVDACSGDERDPALSGGTLLAARRSAREQNGSAAEVATPTFQGPGSAVFPVQLPKGARRREQITAPVATLLRHVAGLSGVSVVEMSGPGGARRVSQARRLAALACRTGERPLTELCAALGISDSAASYLLRTASDEDRLLAREAAELWGSHPGSQSET